MNPQDPTAPPPFPTDGSVVLVEPNAYAGIQTAIADSQIPGNPGTAQFTVTDGNGNSSILTVQEADMLDQNTGKHTTLAFACVPLQD